MANANARRISFSQAETCYKIRTESQAYWREAGFLREFLSLGILNLSSSPGKMAVRGSTRIPCEIPVTLASIDPQNPFCQPCNVILANLGGCAVRSPQPVAAGTMVHLIGLPARAPLAARVVSCISLGQYEKLWLLALALTDPGNVWGIEKVPEDWGQQK